MGSDPLDENPLEPARLQAALERLEYGRGPRRPQLRLTFEPDLEAAFLQHRARAVLILQRVAVLLSVLLYAAYLGYDATHARYYSQPEILSVLLLFALPGHALLFLATLAPQPWRYTFAAARLGTLLHTLGMLLVSTLSTLRGGDGLYEFLILQLMYDFFLLGLVWSQATLLAALTVFAAPLLMVLLGLSGTVVFEYTFFITGTALLGCISSHLHERAQRADWLRAQMLQQLTERDPLTGVFNHRAFYSRGDALIRHARREGRGVAVLGADIDYFKRFNDVYGHLAGDEALRQVAGIVAAHARRPLDMAARLGGEEFAVFLYDTNRAGALARAEDLRAAVKVLQIPGKQSITVSVGVATAAPSDTVTIEAMVGQADVALYRAKHDQRDCVREWADHRPRPGGAMFSPAT